MRLPLKLHSDSHCQAVRGIDVEIARTDLAKLTLRYIVTGAIGDLRLPSPTAPSRADRLWEHTCFEVFIAPAPLAAYYEFNFAPTTQWAGYRFASHRRGRTDIAEVAPPRIEAQTSADRYELQTSVGLESIADLPREAPWLLGISTIIEEASGALSYWALAHPSGKADFHHSDCFAHELSRI